jgi:uncharacterized protein YjbJ (UPF0337 family)
MNGDELSGKANQLKGNVKDAVGGAVGSPGLKAEGKFDQAKGAVQETWGEVKDKASDIAQDAKQELNKAGDRVDEAQDRGYESKQRELPTQGHKMDILDSTISALGGGAAGLPDKLKSWVDTAATAAHAAIDKAASSIAPLADRAKQTGTVATEKVQGVASDLTVKKDQWIDDARAVVKERPLTAIGIATLAGVVLSFLLSSSDSED